MIKLIAMSKNEFDYMIEDVISDFANELKHDNNVKDRQSKEQAYCETKRLLPDDYDNEDHHFLTVRSDSSTLGYIWLQIKEDEKSSFIYALKIYNQYANYGYGTLAMKALEEYCKTIQLNSIKLHVFGHNKTVIHLYHKLGYDTKSIYMEKLLRG